MRLEVNFAGIPLQTPLVLLSGCAGYGEELHNLKGFDFSWIGAICLKGTTLEPRMGNRPPRLCETQSGLLNSIGLQNPGAKHVVSVILPRLAGINTRLIANVAGSTVAEYAEVARWFDDSPVDAMEINISCPNVEHGGAVFGADPIQAAQVVAAVRQVTNKPIITKLSPNVADITLIARATLEAGSNAFSVINTLMGMAVDWPSRRPLLGNLQGGLSGPAIKPIALLKVWQVYQVAAPHGIPILGQGGIVTGQDALEFFLVGATAVGLGTSFMKNPLGVGKMLWDMVSLCQIQNVNEFASLTGTLQREN